MTFWKPIVPYLPAANLDEEAKDAFLSSSDQSISFLQNGS